MSNRAERFIRRRIRRRAGLRRAPLALLFLTSFLGLAGVPGWGPAPLAAQEGPAPPTTPAPSSGLKAQIEESYEVLPTAEGILLRPREEYRGVRSVEILGSDVAINGEVVAREEVRGWLGDRAEAVLRLADLPEAEREELFAGAGVAGESTEPEAEEAAAEGETAEVRVEAPEAPEPPEPPEAPEPPERPRRPRVRRGSQTVVGSTVRIASDEVADDVVVFGGSAVIEGRVEGSVTAFGGGIDVDGEVTRDVTAIGGNVRLGEDAEVGGDATAVAGHVHRAPGARVRGSIEEVDEGWNWGWRGPFPTHDWWRGWEGMRWSPWSWVWNVAWPLAEIFVLALVMMLVTALGRPTVERVGTRAGTEPIKAGLVGLLVAILIVPVLIIVSVLLAVSIIGIPILIVLILLFVFLGVPGLLLMGLVGYTGVAWRLGRWTEGRFGWKLESAYMAVLAGLVLLYGLEVIGKALDFGPLVPFSLMFLGVAAVVRFVAGCVGFGAVFLLLYERRAERRTTLVPQSPEPIEPGRESPPAPSGEAEGEGDDGGSG